MRNGGIIMKDFNFILETLVRDDKQQPKIFSVPVFNEDYSPCVPVCLLWESVKGLNYESQGQAEVGICESPLSYLKKDDSRKLKQAYANITTETLPTEELEKLRKKAYREFRINRILRHPARVLRPKEMMRNVKILTKKGSLSN